MLQNDAQLMIIIDYFDIPKLKTSDFIFIYLLIFFAKQNFYKHIYIIIDKIGYLSTGKNDLVT